MIFLMANNYNITMFFVLTLALVLLSINVNSQKFDGGLLNKTIERRLSQPSEILSRRKRFLIFPEGSSFQLVFCNTFPVITSIGDIFLWGYTSALAFELPQDPYSPFMHHADPLHRRVDTKTIYYTDENGKIIRQHPVAKKKFIVNPAFAKRSVGGSSETSQFKIGLDKTRMDRKLMHARQHSRHFLKSKLSLDFHRRSRSLLYGKIEMLLQSLGANGRQCMLQTLCLVGRARDLSQGSFFQEILRAVFTYPKGSEEILDKDYEEAHWSTASCDETYPCDFTKSGSTFP